MATGGGGGVPTYHVAEAVATLVWKDKAYYDGLRKAEKALIAFGIKANTIGRTMGVGLTGAASGIGRVTTAVRHLNTALTTANVQAAALARSLGAISGMRAPAGLAGLLGARGRMIGNAAAGIGKAIGAAIGGALSGAGGGLGSALGGGGHFVQRGLTGFGNLLKSTAQGFGTVLTASVRNATSLVRTLASALMTPFRMLRSIAGIGGLAGGIGAGVTAYGVGHTASEQERTLATLRRITGASRGEMAALSGGINATAARTPGVGLGRFYEVAETGARMGIPTDQLRGFTEGMARLGIVLDEEELPLKEAANRIGSLISVFGESADSAVRFGSALVKLDQMSTASARDIIDIANRFSGPAAAFGMKPQESLALATALRQARVPVETAGTSVGQVLMRMASRRDMPAFARMAGMKAGEFGSTLERDPIAALKAVTKGLAELDRRMGSVAASRALDKLHLDGQRVRGTLMQLSRTIPLLDQYLATANDEWRNLSAIMEGQAVMGETFTAQWEATKTALKLVAIELGRALLPAMKGFAAGVRNLSGDIAAFVSRNGPAFEAFGQKIRTVLEGIGVLWRQWPDVLQLAGVSVGEKLAQIGKMFENFGNQVVANIRWLGGAIPAIIGNAMSQAAAKAAQGMANVGSVVSGGIGGFLSQLTFGLIGGGGGGGAPAGPKGGAGEQILGNVGNLLGGAIGRNAVAPGLMAGVGAAPGFNAAGLMANLPNRNARQQAIAGRIGVGIRLNRARDFIANPPPWLGNAANIAANPLGAAAGLAGLGAARLQAVLPGLGQPTVGMTVPHTRAWAAAVARKHAAAAMADAADDGDGPRAAPTRAGAVWAANRARRMGINAGFRQWRAGVNAMMRGQAPMMGDGRREVGADPNDPAKKLDKTNSILVDIKNALVGGAGAPANPNKGKGGAAVFG